MRSFFLSVVVLCAPAVALEPSSGPKVQAFLRRCDEAALKVIAKLRADVDELQKLRDAAAADLELTKKALVSRTAKPTDGRKVFQTAQAKKTAIDELESGLSKADNRIATIRARDEATIADIKSGQKLCIPRLPLRYKAGDIGIFGEAAIVVQIIDGENMVIRGSISQELADIIAKVSGTDGETDIRRSRTALAWLRGRSTAGLPDGGVVDLSKATLEVTGSKSYTDARGVTRTLLVLEPFDLEPVKQAIKERAK